MKSLRNKVIMSAIVLVFAVIATIGSTYAWFTVSNQTTVSTMNIEVASSESLLMKAWDTGEVEVEGQVYNHVNYGWTLDDFATVVNIATDSTYYANYGDWRLLPVTALAGETVNQTDYDSIDMTALRYLSDVNTTTRPLAAATANSESGHFLEFKFWMLRPGGTNMDIVFDYTMAGTYADALHIGVIGDTKDISEATDISFDVAGEINSTTTDLSGYTIGDTLTVSGSTANSQTFTVTANSTANQILVSEAVTTESGETVSIVGGDNYTLFGDDLEYAYSWTSTDAGYSGLAIDSVVNAGTSVATALSNISGSEGSTVVNYLESANVPELVTVRVWLEGWDAETTNAVMAATFTLSIQFTLQ